VDKYRRKHAAWTISNEFGPFDGRTWFNTAHQGPLPRPALAALEEAVTMKLNPHRIEDRLFMDVPTACRNALARLIHASADDVVIGNSASYGLHLIANGFPWKHKDEVLVADKDFPATVMPWLNQETRGVTVRYVRPADEVLQPSDLKAAISPSTRLFCASWVNPFCGARLDIAALGRLCRELGVWCVINASQAIGARELDLSQTPVDAVISCGYKWLCGPYGTGFAWIAPGLRGKLLPTQAYWLPMLWGRGGCLRHYKLRQDLGARAFDVFGTADFFDLMPWTAAVQYINRIGIEKIEKHNDDLAAIFRAQLDPKHFIRRSPRDPQQQSAIVVFSHRNTNRNRAIWSELSNVGIDVALREGNLRAAFHLFNSRAEVEQTLELLSSAVQKNR